MARVLAAGIWARRVASNYLSTSPVGLEQGSKGGGYRHLRRGLSWPKEPTPPRGVWLAFPAPRCRVEVGKAWPEGPWSIILQPVQEPEKLEQIWFDWSHMMLGSKGKLSRTGRERQEQMG